jgi:anti-sigma B factor antagonist
VFSTVLSIRHRHGHTVVTLSGELDLIDAAAVATALMASADLEPWIVVDLARLEFIDASGLAALARARKHARRAGGDLLLAAPQRQVRRLLRTAAEGYRFSVHASAEEAASGFRDRGAGLGLRWPRRALRQANWG